MRHTARILAVAAFATAVVAMGAAPSGAGGIVENTVTVAKQVSGPVPIDATFTVEVSCVSSLGSLAPPPDVTDVTFDSQGNPTSGNEVISVGAGHQCTVTETDSAGAAGIAYQCSIERGGTDDDGPPFLGNCGPDDNQATFGDVIGDAATITVVNTFETTPAPPIEPVTPAAQAVQAAPTFTG